MKNNIIVIVCLLGLVACSKAPENMNTYQKRENNHRFFLNAAHEEMGNCAEALGMARDTQAQVNILKIAYIHAVAFLGPVQDEIKQIKEDPHLTESQKTNLLKDYQHIIETMEQYQERLMFGIKELTY